MKPARLALAAAGLLLPASADAAIFVNINQVGSDVVATVFGSLDLAGLRNIGGSSPTVGVRGRAGYVGVGNRPGFALSFLGFNGPAGFGSGQFLTQASTSSGQFFGFQGSNSNSLVFLDPGYRSNTFLFGTATFLGSSITGLGLTSGTYFFTSARDSISITVGPSASAVPEPASWALMMAGFGLVGATLRRRSARVAVRYS